ncbi:hypothetical protein BC827DRAFT_1155983 [Russula dissimulans]|nr:hypothetical protein BC827DRAFT_1155983 [Russula dissimulans]
MKHEEEVQVIQMSEERKRQWVADLERIKLQQQGEEELARQAEEWRKQPLAATITAAQDHDSSSHSSMLSGLLRLFSCGGGAGRATPAWHLCEQAKSTTPTAGSPASSAAASSEPKKPLLSISFKDITIPSFLWHNIGGKFKITGHKLGNHAPQCLFKLVKAEPGPYCTDTVEDWEGCMPWRKEIVGKNK